MSESRTARRVRITGRVQGVGFRAWLREEAERRSLSGWVRNEEDGSVSALICGPATAVQAMLAILHDGPPDAAVTDVDTRRAEPDGIPADFTIDR